MAEPKQVMSSKRTNTDSSFENGLSFFVEQMIKQNVNTAIPVRIDSCTVAMEENASPAGYVSATPLVSERSAEGKALQPVSIPKLPFFRTQCGKAAIVMNPKAGDIGLAVFAQQDCSNVKTGTKNAVTAGSFRSFDMSDGFYIGGFMGETPETFIHLDSDGQKITIKCPQKVEIEAPDIELKASSGIKINSPLTEASGVLKANQIIDTSRNVNVGTHTHSGVEHGSDNTGQPNGG